MLTKDLHRLKEEIEKDPQDRGYADMSDEEIADDMNEKRITRDVNSFSGDFMFTNTDPDEFGDLADHQQNLWVSFCSKASIDPWAANNEQFVKWIFGNNSTTVGNLGNARTEKISRARELGYSSVSATKIKTVRSK